MYRIGAAVLLSLILTLLSVNLAQADLWRCHQAGGPDLFTDSLKSPSTCEKYALQTELSYASGSLSSTPPSVAPSQPILMEKLPAPPETRREDTEPDTPPYDDQEPFYYTYPYSGGYWFPFIFGHPRHHHQHHQHHERSSSHRGVAHSSGHGGHR